MCFIIRLGHCRDGAGPPRKEKEHGVGNASAIMNQVTSNSREPERERDCRSDPSEKGGHGSSH